MKSFKIKSRNVLHLFSLAEKNTCCYQEKEQKFDFATIIIINVPLQAYLSQDYKKRTQKVLTVRDSDGQ